MLAPHPHIYGVWVMIGHEIDELIAIDNPLVSSQPLVFPEPDPKPQPQPEPKLKIKLLPKPKLKP